MRIDKHCLYDRNLILYTNFSFAVMSQCWCENTINRPKFSELSSIMDQSLSLVSDYTELGMVLYEDDEGTCKLHEHTLGTLLFVGTNFSVFSK